MPDPGYERGHSRQGVSGPEVSAERAGWLALANEILFGKLVHGGVAKIDIKDGEIEVTAVAKAAPGDDAADGDESEGEGDADAEVGDGGGDAAGSSGAGKSGGKPSRRPRAKA